MYVVVGSLSSWTVNFHFFLLSCILFYFSFQTSGQVLHHAWCCDGSHSVHVWSPENWRTAFCMFSVSLVAWQTTTCTFIDGHASVKVRLVKCATNSRPVNLFSHLSYGSLPRLHCFSTAHVAALITEEYCFPIHLKSSGSGCE